MITQLLTNDREDFILKNVINKKYNVTFLEMYFFF